MKMMNNSKSYLAILLIISIALPCGSHAQAKQSENIVVITLDGFRWREIFSGADSLLTFDTTAKYNTEYVQQRFWASSPNERRK
jgi:hypothetical protein